MCSIILKPKSIFVVKHDQYNIVLLSESEIQYALNYYFMKATQEIKRFNNSKFIKNNSVEKGGILYHVGRVLDDNVSFKTSMSDVMIDLSKSSFIVPIVYRYSPLAYSIVNQVHWFHSTVKHSGVETTIPFIMTIAHILHVREILKLVRRRCTRCRYILKRTVEVQMGPKPRYQLCVAPPFYYTQVDLCGHFRAYSIHNKRTTIKVWITTFVCCTTGMCNLKIMEGYDTTQFLLAFTRFACEVGYPKLLLPDEGSQLVSGCKSMNLDMMDIKGKLNREFGIEFNTCPVGGHHFHGKAERKIKAVQESLEKTVHSARLSNIQWETLCAEIANSLNNMPIAIGNEVEDLESLDLITPNRLKLGRNNERSPVGVLDVTDKVDRIIQLNCDIFTSWWEHWLISVVPKIIPQPKWFKSDQDIKVGDVVLFNKQEGSIAGNYKLGMVDDVKFGEDGLTLWSLIIVPPWLLIFQFFSTQDILIPTPLFIDFGKIFQSGNLLK